MRISPIPLETITVNSEEWRGDPFLGLAFCFGDAIFWIFHLEKLILSKYSFINFIHILQMIVKVKDIIDFFIAQILSDLIISHD